METFEVIRGHSFSIMKPLKITALIATLSIQPKQPHDSLSLQSDYCPRSLAERLLGRGQKELLFRGPSRILPQKPNLYNILMYRAKYPSIRFRFIQPHL